MGYLAAVKNITCLVLHYMITFAQIGTLFKPPSQNLSVNLVIPPALEEKLVEYLLLRGNISDALETMLEDQLSC